MLNEIALEGNKGGDYIHIKLLPDGRIALEVGHSCAIFISHIVPVEFLTAILAQAVADGPIEAMKNVEWPAEYLETLVSQIEDNSINSFLHR